MKKLFFLGAFALSTFAFANTSDVKLETSKKETYVNTKESTFSNQKYYLSKGIV